MFRGYESILLGLSDGDNVFVLVSFLDLFFFVACRTKGKKPRMVLLFLLFLNIPGLLDALGRTACLRSPVPSRSRWS